MSNYPNFCLYELAPALTGSDNRHSIVYNTHFKFNVIRMYVNNLIYIIRGFLIYIRLSQFCDFLLFINHSVLFPHRLVL